MSRSRLSGLLKGNVGAVYQALGRLRAHGYSRLSVALFHLATATLVRCYRVGARPLNASVPFGWINRRRIQALGPPAKLASRFYVIVVPGTLHFLVPCLSLIPSRVQLILVGNGASGWEMTYLRCKFPGLIQCRLLTLPGSSLTHGDAITLLLQATEHGFGIIDHDFYAFDQRLFADLDPGPKHCLTAVLGDATETGLYFPHTYFLYFNAALMRALIERYGVDARIYREAPRALAPVLESIGLHRTAYLKQHHQFFDTLTLLYALAVAEGFPCRFIQGIPEDCVRHVGSTSSGVAKTKPLVETYIHRSFLEAFGDSPLIRRYQRRYAGSSSAKTRARIPLTPENFAKLQAVDALVARLKGVLERQATPHDD